MKTEEVLSRLADFERVIRQLELEIHELRDRVVAAPEPEAPVVGAVRPESEPEPEPEQPIWAEGVGYVRPSWQPPALEREPEPEPAAVAAREDEPAGPAEPPIWRREIDFADFLGAKGLAWAGGIVTLLGIVFFFALAANRGWIGPAARVGLGAGASAGLFVAGILMRRRYGRLYSAFTAVGAGIAGGYVTLLAAAALYDLVSKPLALALATVIAAAGLALALAWSSELVAGLGLIGAMLMPATLVADGGLTEVGTGFVAIVFAATAAVAVRRDWRELLWIGLLASLPQVAFLVAQAEPSFDAGLVALAAGFWLLFLAAGLAYQLAIWGDGLGRLATSFVLASATFAASAAGHLFEGTDEGVALLAIAAVYAGLAAVLFRPEARRQLAVLLAGAGLTVAAIGVADLLSGETLTYAWAAEGVLLAWLAVQVREIRFQLASFAYLGLGAGHALVFEASPDRLFVSGHDPGAGVLPAAAVAAALGLAGWAARSAGYELRGEGIFAAIDRAFAALAAAQAHVRAALVAAGALAGAYALGLGIVELFGRAGDGGPAFEWGHLTVTAVWAALGLAAVCAGLYRPSTRLTSGALAWLTVVALKTVFFDTGHLSDERWAYAYLAVAAAVLLAGCAFALYDDRAAGLHWVTAGASLLALGLALVAVTTVVDGHVAGVDARGLAYVGVALAYAVLAAAAFRRRRDASTLLWALALAVAAGADAQLLGGDWRVLGWSLAAAALAWLAPLAGEPRLRLASVGYLAVAFGYALVVRAPAHDLFVVERHPAAGAASVFFVAGAVLAFALSFVRDAGPAEDRLDRDLERSGGTLAASAYWIACGLGVYGLSLSILGLFQAVGVGDLRESFESGHTAVSALWGTLGLILLYVGLRRQARSLRLAGFGLFAVSLGKLFLFDLARLSSVTRAASFLAVGAVLLLAGFFYQRLSSQPERGGA